MRKTRTGLIAALDIGSTKVCCLIAQSVGDGAIRIVGVGHHASKGLRGGAVIDMDAAQSTILTAISAAEELAGERIREVMVNVSGGGLASQTYSVEAPVSGREITEADLRSVLSQGNGIEQPEDRELLHCIPVGYKIDATRGIRDPRGMYADMLGVDVHIVSARTAALRNVATCVQRCHLDIEATVAAPTPRDSPVWWRMRSISASPLWTWAAALPPSVSSMTVSWFTRTPFQWAANMSQAILPAAFRRLWPMPSE